MAITMPAAVNDSGGGTDGTILDVVKWLALGTAIDTELAVFLRRGLIAITPINTYVVLVAGYENGLYVFRDNSNGGLAVWMTDSSVAPTKIAGSGNLANLVMQIGGTGFEVKISSGSTSAQVSWILLRCA